MKSGLFRNSMLIKIVNIILVINLITGGPFSAHFPSALAADSVRTPFARGSGATSDVIIELVNHSFRIGAQPTTVADVADNFAVQTTTSTAAILTALDMRGAALGETDKKLIAGIKEQSDGLAKRAFQDIANSTGVILVVHVSEGFGRDEVAESFRANEVVVPLAISGEVKNINEAIGKDLAIYTSQSGRPYKIEHAIIDVIEGTNAFVSNVDGRELSDLSIHESGATSILVGGPGVESLGNCPDIYADSILTVVPKEKRQEFVDNPLDPELTAENPGMIEAMLTRIADANGISLNDLEVVVMDRKRETLRLDVIKQLQQKYNGLELVTIKDGTVAHSLLATFGRREGKHKVVMTVGGSPEANFNLAIAGLFKEEGAIASLRPYSKNVNKTVDGEDALDLSRRYIFSPSEMEELRMLRPEDADEIIGGRRLCTQEDVKGGVEAGIAFITNNGVFGVEGVRESEDGGYSITVLRIGTVDNKPSVWFEERKLSAPKIIELVNMLPRHNFVNVEAVHAALAGVVELTSSGAVVLDEARLRDELIDRLVYDATFNTDQRIQALCRDAISGIAEAQGITLESVYNLYVEKAADPAQYSFPAINIRGMAYNTGRAVFASAKRNGVGTMICEIAKSEIGYTGQRPAEFTTSVLAAAIKEGYNHPLFLQGDHFQISQKDYAANPEAARESIKDLIREAIEAGFYQIDLDMSTLVDWTKPTVDEQQKNNYRETALLTAYVRELERELGLDKRGIVVNLGGEIGEIGIGLDKAQQQNSTVEELRAFMKGYNSELARLSQELGYVLKPITKLAIQTGTKHGGVRGAKGQLVQAKVSFNTIAELGRVAREEYGLAGVVQHGASTLPTDYFTIFAGKEVPEGFEITEELLNEEGKGIIRTNPAAEVHLATAYQDTTIDHAEFPQDLLQQMRGFILEKYPVKEGQDPDKVFVDNRKNAWGPFKLRLWNMPTSVQDPIRESLTDQFDTVFNNLGVRESQVRIARLRGDDTASRGADRGWMTREEHDYTNDYIKTAIEEGRAVRLTDLEEDLGVRGNREIWAISGLLEATGFKGHYGISTRAIYVDANYPVAQHELDELDGILAYGRNKGWSEDYLRRWLTSEGDAFEVAQVLQDIHEKATPVDAAGGGVLADWRPSSFPEVMLESLRPVRGAADAEQTSAAMVARREQIGPFTKEVLNAEAGAVKSTAEWYFDEETRDGDVYVRLIIGDKFFALAKENTKEQTLMTLALPPGLNNSRSSDEYYSLLLSYAASVTARENKGIELIEKNGSQLKEYLSQGMHTADLTLPTLIDGSYSGANLQANCIRNLYGSDKLFQMEYQPVSAEPGARPVLFTEKKSSRPLARGCSFIVQPKRTVLINGYGVIGSKAADAARRSGFAVAVAVRSEPRISDALSKGYPVYFSGSNTAEMDKFKDAGINFSGALEEALASGKIDAVIDGTPGGVGAANLENTYSKYPDLVVLLEGGEAADAVEESFSSSTNYDSVRGKSRVRIVSCNTTGMARIYGPLLEQFRLYIDNLALRRGADPGETKGPNPDSAAIIPAYHHGPDFRTILSEKANANILGINTDAGLIPSTHYHLHNGTISGEGITVDMVKEILKAQSRVGLIEFPKGQFQTPILFEIFNNMIPDANHPYIIPAQVLPSSIEGQVKITFAVPQESNVVPENVNALQAVFGFFEKDAGIRLVNEVLGIDRIKAGVEMRLPTQLAQAAESDTSKRAVRGAARDRDRPALSELQSTIQTAEISVHNARPQRFDNFINALRENKESNHGVVVVGANAILENAGAISALKMLKGTGYEVVVWAQHEAQLELLKVMGIEEITKTLISYESSQKSLEDILSEYGKSGIPTALIASPLDRVNIDLDNIKGSGVETVNLQSPEAKETKSINSMPLAIGRAVASLTEDDYIINRFEELTLAYVDARQVSSEDLAKINNLTLELPEMPLVSVSEEVAQAQITYEETVAKI
ncbi:type II glyceraldehyde-3-phosphate dehydrogenase [Candidatus Omnitrophota bacterium]